MSIHYISLMNVNFTSKGCDKMYELVDLVEKIEGSIFSYDINKLSESMPLLINEVSNLMVYLNEKEVNLLNEILNYIYTSMGNKDYLLLADILHYELIPLFSNSVYIRGIN
jgi:hypothetical protein